MADVLEGSVACELKELIPKSSHPGGSTGPPVAFDAGVSVAFPPESVQKQPRDGTCVPRPSVRACAPVRKGDPVR